MNADGSLDADDERRITADVYARLGLDPQGRPIARPLGESVENLYKQVGAAERAERDARQPQYREPTQAEIVEFTRNTSNAGTLWEGAGLLERVRRARDRG